MRAAPHQSIHDGTVGSADERVPQVVMNRDYAQDYVYANVPCPWMQVALDRGCSHALKYCAAR